MLKKSQEIFCKKDLYKSTYGFNAFNKGKKYKISGYHSHKLFILIIDEEGHLFDFSTTNNLNGPYYIFDEYFDTLSKIRDEKIKYILK